MRDSELTEDRAAELGYRETGQREVSLRDWFSLREPGTVAETPREFAKVVNRLRVRKWAKANPERRRAIANRYALKPENLTRSMELARARRYELHKKKPPIVCTECGVLFCAAKAARGSYKREFCTNRCQAANEQRRKRRAVGARETSCRACGESGHNSRRHAR